MDNTDSTLSHDLIVPDVSNAERQFAFTDFSSDTTTQGARTLLSWQGLCDRLRFAPQHASKKACPLMRPGTFAGNSRASGSPLHTADALAADYDANQMPVAEAAALLRKYGIKACIYTSASHGVAGAKNPDGGPRWRVIAPLSRSINEREHEALMDLLNGALGGVLGPESWHWARCYYFGHVKGVEFDFESIDGTPLDIVAECPDFDPAPATRPAKPTKQIDRSVIVTDDPVVRHLQARDEVTGGVRGKVFCVCPRKSEHNPDHDVPSSTAWLLATATEPARFHCAHESHGFIGTTEFLDATGFYPPVADEFPDARAIVAQIAAALEAESAIAKAKASRFEPSPWHTFAGGASPSWLVRGVLPQAELCVIYGESGSGKTFFALDLVGAVARGVEWRGRRVKVGRVVYICAEGAAGFRKRVQAYARQHGLANDAMRLDVIADAPNLLSDDYKSLTLAIGSASVIVVDTLAQTTPGANENSAEDMGLALAHCKALHRATGALIVLIHHSGKDAARGARGWSGLKGACDAEIEVTRTKDIRAARISKQKDGEEGDTMPFQLMPVLLGFDDEGEEITSCTVGVAAAPPVAREEPKGKIQQLVLGVFHEKIGTATRIPEAALIAHAVEMLPPPGDDKEDRRRDTVRRAVCALVEDAFLCKVGEDIAIA